MQVGCNLKVGHSVFLDLLGSEPSVLESYWKWVCKSFTDNNKSIRWCPSVGCGYYYQQTNPGMLLKEIRCDCGTVLCFPCGNLSHMPAKCDVANRWNVKASAESENINWIAANTKTCPKCKKPIEKN